MEKNIKNDMDRVDIPEEVVNKIIEELTSVMKKKIQDISPSDDPNADYGERWTTGSYNDDDWLELDEPFEEYDVSYHYRLSWRYRVWTEYFTDPVYSQSLDEMEGESGIVHGITINTPDGDKVKDSICERIAKTVNGNIE